MSSEVRICVTGLSRAGKTAFITALVDALHRAREAPRAFPNWAAAAQGRLRGASLLPMPSNLGALQVFPYEQNRRDLTGDPPRWPAATEVTRAICVRITTAVPDGLLRRSLNFLTRQPNAETLAHTTLTIVDYPGEWVLDLPLLEQDFATWSAQTLGMTEEGLRREEAGPFLEILSRLDPLAPYDDGRAIAAHVAYVDYLVACRERHHLSLLQPGLFLRPEDVGGRAGLTGREAYRFFPMKKPDKSVPKGSAYAVIAGRYEAYKRDRVQAFFKSLQGTGGTRQVVLFDLLTALSRGEHAYTDARNALSRIAEAMRPRPGLIQRWFGAPTRILYAVTKADHLASIDRTNLEVHMSALIGDLQAAQADTGGRQATKVLALASICCTRDGVNEKGELSAVGMVRDAETGLIERDQALHFPPPPAGLPTPAHWALLRKHKVIGFRFPEFLLEPGQLKDRPDLPHVKLDEAIRFLLGDYV